MTTPQPTQIRTWHTLVVLAIVAIGSSVLFLFNPAQHGFYPLCVFHKLTGLNCPGCGALRALHQLSHGHVLEALRLNALLVLALPFLLFALTRAWWQQQAGNRQTRPLLRPVWVWMMLVVIVAFGILRNLPLPLLAQLSP
jgi:hypothetical protein